MLCFILVPHYRYYTPVMETSALVSTIARSVPIITDLNMIHCVWIQYNVFVHQQTIEFGAFPLVGLINCGSKELKVMMLYSSNFNPVPQKPQNKT